MTTEIEQLTNLYGDPTLAPPATETLNAGPVSVVFTAAGDIRYVRYGKHELIRRVYAAVRAGDWHTVPATMTIREKIVNKDSFHIVCWMQYASESHGIAYRATITITGEANGRITYDFDGQAVTAFERNRIGICVLHPREAKGAATTVTHSDGSTAAGFLPDTILPDQPFFDISAIRHTVAPGIEAETTFAGEVFEMEDQRNWLDASFKTYSTPQERPKPVQVFPGDHVHQTVTLTPHIAADIVPETASEPTPPETTRETAAKIGSVGVVWSEEMVAPGFVLGLPPTGHIWLDLDLAKPEWNDLLQRADTVAQAHRLSLYVCLRNTSPFLESSARLPTPQSPTRWFVNGLTERDALAAVREIVPGSAIGAGFTSNFTELNRSRPDSSSVDSLFFAVGPQVHADDALSIAETPPTIDDSIRTARTFAGGKPIHVGPITFGRSGDARESASFGQEWYKQIIAHAANAGADSITVGTNALPLLRNLWDGSSE